MSWQRQGKCDGELYWTELPKAEQLDDCGACPVAFRCLEAALTQEMQLAESMAAESGMTPLSHLSHLRISRLPIYGGKTIDERVAILSGRLGQPPAPGRVRVEPVIRDECGTLTGYRLHGQHGERKCEDCRQHHNSYQATRRTAARSA